MNDDVDSKLGALLLADAPPERDPMFRIRVLERRERERYGRRLRGLLAGASLVLLVHGVALLLAPDVFTAGVGAVIGLAILGAGAVSATAVLRVARALRR